MTETPFSIYTLSDPRTGEVRYIGMSCATEKRYQAHLGAYQNASKRDWIRELQANQLLPLLSIIESGLTMKSAKERELTWIQHYLRQGAPLLNISGVTKPWVGGVCIGTKPKPIPKKKAPQDELLTVEEVARILKMHPYTVRRLLREGGIRGTKVTGRTGSTWRVRQSEVDRLMGQQETNSNTEEI